jgi:1,2-diacylglycerol 3-alpha-glucosyltransferase
MRIGFFSDMYLPRTDGIAISIESFRTELESMGHEVYVFAPQPSFRYKDPSKRITRFPAIKGLFFDDYMTSLFFPPQAMRKIHKLNLDIIHYHTPSQIGLLGAYFALHNNIPLITTYHTDLYEYVKHYPAVLPGTIALSMLVPAITGGGMSEFRTGLSSIRPEKSVDKWNQKLVQRGITMMHNHCDLVITPSKKIEEQLHSWKTASKVVVLPTGVDKITTNEREITAFRKHFGLQPDHQVILTVSRIGTEKNLGLSIKVFEQVARHNPKARLVIVGTGDDLELFQAQAAKTKFADRIIFTGHIEHSKLGAAYGVASVFIFTSLTDTQGLVLGEAAQAGLPIVMIDAEVTEVMRDGQNGFASRGKVRDLSDKIRKILDDPKLRQTMGRRSVELASDYSVAKQSKKLIELYEETIARHTEQTPSELKAPTT